MMMLMTEFSGCALCFGLVLCVSRFLLCVTWLCVTQLNLISWVNFMLSYLRYSWSWCLFLFFCELLSHWSGLLLFLTSSLFRFFSPLSYTLSSFFHSVFCYLLSSEPCCCHIFSRCYFCVLRLICNLLTSYLSYSLAVIDIYTLSLPHAPPLHYVVAHSYIFLSSSLP